MPRIGRTSAQSVVLFAAFAAACAISLVWPGDAPFINDEPLLISGALRANAAAQLAQVGLKGTFGFSYGPAPTWVYQVLVALTRNLVVMVTLHTLLMTAVTGFALWWISRSLRLWPWFAVVPLVSPYFWFYARVLWDNPFLMPLGALAVAGYAAVLASESAVGLRVALCALLTIPLVHLMGIAFVVPFAAHILVVRWRTLWAHRVSVAAIGGVFAIVAWPYWKYLATAAAPGRESAAGMNGWLFPLMGGRLLSARQLDYFFGPEPVSGTVLQAAASLSWLAYALVWIGLVVAVAGVVRAATAHQWTPKAHISALLIAMLACQACLDAFTGRVQHPQYQNATWIAFTLLAWLAVDWLAVRRPAIRWMAPAVTGVLAFVLIATVATIAIRLHRTSGTRAIYGPTVANQQRVARDLARYSPYSRVSSSVLAYDLYPHALDTLRRLNPQHDGNGPPRFLDVRYASTDPASGAIEVVVR